MRRVGLIDITVGNATRLGASQRSTTRRCASHHIAAQRASRWGHPGGSRAFSAEPLGGGSPVRSVYFVAEKDPEKAKAIIGAMMAPNEKVEAWGRLPEAAVKALGLKPGDFKHG